MGSETPQGSESGGRPAIAGGEPLFPCKVPILKPDIPPLDPLLGDLRSVIASGMLTNGPKVQKFERTIAEFLGVREVVAVSSCTAGLMLTFRALGLRGEVVLPSFTFHATGSALLWNNLIPVFADCDPDTFCIDPQRVEENITERTAGILAVHMYGHPAKARELEELARKYSLPLIFDAAHAFGARYHGVPVGGFGCAEVFSLSPTKLITSAEGGLVATNDPKLAKLMRAGRNYGDPGTYDPELLGLNARMSELHATLGLHTFNRIQENVQARNMIRLRYEKGFSSLPGLSFQKIHSWAQSTCKDFSVLVDPEPFGMSRDLLCDALAAENVETKKYFYPPLHRQKQFSPYYRPQVDPLVVTDKISSRVLSFPIYSALSVADVDGICEAVKGIQGYVSKLSVEEHGHLLARASLAVAR